MTKPAEIDLDRLLLPEEAARWLRLSKNRLLRAARVGAIPSVRLNSRTIRFHPRTILSKAAHG